MTQEHTSDTPKAASPDFLRAVEFGLGELARAHPLFRHFQIFDKSIRAGAISCETVFSKKGMDIDTMHSGVLTVILDSLMAFATMSFLEKLMPLATINLKSDFYQPLPPDTRMIVTCHCEGIQNDVAVCSGKVVHAHTGTLYATAAATFMIGTKGPTQESRV